MRLVDAARHQLLTDRGIGLAVGRAIAETDHLAARQPHPARALNLQEKQLDRIDIGDLEPAPGQRAALVDFLPGEPWPLCGQIVGHAVDRGDVASVRHLGAAQLRLVIAGEQRVPPVLKQHRKEEQFEETPRVVGFAGQRAERLPVAVTQVAAGFEKGFERGGVIVLGPTAELLETEQLGTRRRGERQPEGQGQCRRAPDHSPVATSFQLGSSLPMMRPKVQTSRWRLISEVEPSTISPAVLRTT